MRSKLCQCTHDKKDHTMLSGVTTGSCKICLCNTYQAQAATEPADQAIDMLPLPQD
ncbi:MAG: hypothetical protein AB7O65_07915 [Candidatus Korobacteraceae bacterium]